MCMHITHRYKNSIDTTRVPHWTKPSVASERLRLIYCFLHCIRQNEPRDISIALLMIVRMRKQVSLACRTDPFDDYLIHRLRSPSVASKPHSLREEELEGSE